VAGPSGYLSPEHSALAIELAWQTVGTAGVADTAASRTVELTRQAIASWRHLAGLDNSPNEAGSVNNRREVASQAEFVLAR
jgi:hypothetical protein